jgi:hypothetical protein
MTRLTTLSTIRLRWTAMPRGAAWLLAVIGILGAPVTFAQDPACKPLFDAMTHLFNTPSHQYVTQTSTALGGQPQESELINTGSAMYVLIDGKWHASHLSAAQLQEREEENRKSAKVTNCKVVREEAIDGVPVTVFNSHTETGFGVSDQQIWLSKSTGLPLRETIDMDLGEKTGKSHVEVRVVYVKIEAPANVVP